MGALTVLGVLGAAALVAARCLILNNVLYPPGAEERAASGADVSSATGAGSGRDEHPRRAA